MNPTIYPPAPAGVPSALLQPSASFRKQVAAVVRSIILFLIVYIALMIAAVALAALCFYFGVAIIIALPKFLTIVAGVGLMAVGVSVIFFLIKFIFSVSKMENAGRVEVTETEQPRLFAFIRRLSEETRTPFPKKIFLSPDVNACVFYNSSFWSMFFPVRKNLEIGVGLVNSLNVSEFKAVIAHEFGHFSQRSMKLGSFTYNVNRVIYNMLYENRGYGRFLQAWGNLDGLLSVFAVITAKIAQGIQSILKLMYQRINKDYLGLSREMEFHADAIAASVAGGNNIISGLGRIQLAQGCYSTALEYAGDWVKEKKKMSNIFSNQRLVFQRVAADNKLPLQDGLPIVDLDFLSRFSESRVNYQDQWASHPTINERKINVDLLALEVPQDHTAAWDLFDHPEKVQQQFTSKVYETIQMEADTSVATTEDFSRAYDEQVAEYTVPAMFKGFYDNRLIDALEWNMEEVQATALKETPASLYSEENGSLPKTLQNNRKDLEILRAIESKQIEVKSFDFDGVKYPSTAAAEVIGKLEAEINQQVDRMDYLDKQSWLWFRTELQEAFTNAFARYVNTLRECRRYSDTVTAVMQRLEPLYNEVSLEQAQAVLSGFKNGEEKELKKMLQAALDLNVVDESANPGVTEEIRDFLSKDYAYLIGPEFQQHELRAVTTVLFAVDRAWALFRFREFKQLLSRKAGATGQMAA
ncbi:MAG: hypothetical protein EOO09_20900 [Chitinophagaceae bacterium]|nr:MAG: hypothetical protein EOO09_20900 [Chitinophagaceae bacterium]